jgi:hypothetical protein
LKIKENLMENPQDHAHFDLGFAAERFELVEGPVRSQVSILPARSKVTKSLKKKEK